MADGVLRMHMHMYVRVKGGGKDEETDEGGEYVAGKGGVLPSNMVIYMYAGLLGRVE